MSQSPPFADNSHAPAPTLCVDADVAWLRCSRAESGYRNVYRSGSFFVAKVKEASCLRTLPNSRSAHAHQAAVHVVAWYRERFGARWREAVLNRKRRPWAIHKSGKWGGWVVSVWANGKRVELHRKGAPDSPAVFPMRCHAFDFVTEEYPELIGPRSWSSWRS